MQRLVLLRRYRQLAVGSAVSCLKLQEGTAPLAERVDHDVGPLDDVRARVAGGQVAGLARELLERVAQQPGPRRVQHRMRHVPLRPCLVVHCNQMWRPDRFNSTRLQCPPAVADGIKGSKSTRTAITPPLSNYWRRLAFDSCVQYSIYMLTNSGFRDGQPILHSCLLAVKAAIFCAAERRHDLLHLLPELVTVRTSAATGHA